MDEEDRSCAEAVGESKVVAQTVTATVTEFVAVPSPVSQVERARSVCGQNLMIRMTRRTMTMTRRRRRPDQQEES